MAGVLQGIRVVELSEGWSAAAICGRILADLGAEVIKVEPPDGDALRKRGPFVSQTSIPFNFVSGGKRSLILDLDDGPATIERILRIAGDADILVEGPYRGPRIEAKQSARFERLIHCSISAFGRLGELSGLAGSELIVQAASGLMASTGHADALPTRVGVPVAEHTGAIFATTAIAAALIHRRAHHKGQFIDVSEQDGLFCFHSSYLPKVFLEGEAPPRMGFRHPMISPWDVYKTRDGRVIVCTGTNDHWTEILRVVGATGFDPADYATPAQRVRNADGVQKIIESWTCQHTVDEVVKSFEEIGVPSGPLLDLRSLLVDPHFLARGMLLEVEDGCGNSIPVSGSIFRMSRTPGVPAGPAPSLGDAVNAIPAAVAHEWSEPCTDR